MRSVTANPVQKNFAKELTPYARMCYSGYSVKNSSFFMQKLDHFRGGRQPRRTGGSVAGVGDHIIERGGGSEQIVAPDDSFQIL